MSDQWSIQVDKEAMKFSAAHFLIFPDGTAERLHGHNYRIYVEVEGPLCDHGLVLDFQGIKPLVQAICDELDEHWLIPGQHPVLEVEAIDDSYEIRYRNRQYRAPQEDVLVLPINNTSAENLAAWFGGELRSRIRRTFPEVELSTLMVSVEETPGQRGVWRSDLRTEVPAQ